MAGAFALLRALGQAPEPLGVTALASAVGIPKTTAHCLLEQMAAEGVVERRDRKWRLGPGVYDLARRGLSGAPSAGLGAAARHRLEALSKATGATLFLHRYSRRTLETVCHASGVRVTHHVTAGEQDMAARHPASALWRALGSGRLSAEYGEVRPECNCIAVPFPVSGGGIAVLSLARPKEDELESLKRPLERVAATIRADLKAWTA
ncbi:helix-turn-helix domain-containing protein [Streptomyces althioticus]|uniref:helix-turn-helix domain-containing protein n=1 Tax=Streptomyces TaxID=1883 RepID=UPI0033CB5CFC